jgi:HEAT repeat protein
VEKAGPDEGAKIGSGLHEALSDRHIPVRREALLALVRMRDRKGEETAVEWLTSDKAEGVRDAAIRCVRELDLREHIPTIRKHLHDENEVVRISAIVTLSQWGDEESRPAIEEAAKAKSFRLRRCAEMALKRLDQAARTKREAGGDDREPGVVPKDSKESPPF